MAYAESSLSTVGQLKKLAEITKETTDDLAQAQAVLDARMDEQVTASTDSDADYAAEVVDARVDTWANEHGSLGTNIRDGQQRLAEAIEFSDTTHQAQIDELSETRLENLAVGIEAHDRRRQEILTEEEIRIDNDESIQTQIKSLSDAVLHISLQLSELREILRLKQEE